MSKVTQRKDLPPEIMHAFSELFHPLWIPQVRRRALDEFLTQDEVAAVVQDLGPDTVGAEYLISGKNILSVLAAHRDWSLERALLELTLALDMIGPGRYQFLRKAIGEPLETPTLRSSLAEQPTKPNWNRADGTLKLGKEVIRSVRICRTPSRIQRLFEAFEAAQWPTNLKNPFSELDQANLHRFLNDVNGGLKRIRFHGRAGGDEVTWSSETDV
jgi:hypothetical protein